jgi:hypothetical protein
MHLHRHLPRHARTAAGPLLVAQSNLTPSPNPITIVSTLEPMGELSVVITDSTSPSWSD